MALAALAAAACAGPPQEVGRYDPLNPGQPRVEERTPVRNFEALIGARQLEDDEAWDPLDDQFEVGLGFQIPLLGERSEARLDLADYVDWDFGIRYAFDQSDVSGVSVGQPDRELDAETWDASIGLLVTPGAEEAWIRPYVGVGAALLYTDVEFLGPTGFGRDSSTLFTAYARGGVRFRFRQGQYFGIDARWLFGDDGDVDGLDASAEALSVAFLFGARF
ncbi:MAG: hypothetical protein AAF726_07300 [Planctomycetota bacterium]